MQRASLIAELVRNLPAMQETQVLSLGAEDPLEKEMATYSSILAWKISWTEEPGRATVHGVAKSWTWLNWTEDCSLPGSSVHEIFQARILEWVVISSSRGSSWHRDWSPIFCLLHWLIFNQNGSYPILRREIPIYAAIALYIMLPGSAPVISRS